MQVSIIQFKNNYSRNRTNFSFGSNALASNTNTTNDSEKNKKKNKKKIIICSTIGMSLIVGLLLFFNRQGGGGGSAGNKIAIRRGGGNPNKPIRQNKQHLKQKDIPSIETEDYNNYDLPRILIQKANNVIGRQNIYKSLEQENIWALYSEDRFTNFLNDNKELKEILDLKTREEYGLTTSFQDILKDSGEFEDFKNFTKTLQSKYNLDLSLSPKIYRFIGESELDVLKSNKEVANLRFGQPGIDVTTNPDLNFGLSKYRITFKDDKRFSVHPNDEKLSEVRIHGGTNNEDYYWLKTPYNINDIEKIEKRTQNGFEEITI